MPFVSEKDGRLYSHKIEYNLADHCNLSCRECSHLSPYVRKQFPSLPGFEQDVRRLAEVYRVQRFRFVGGEPLLNRELVLFARAVRESGIAREIEIVTNGVLLERVDDEILHHVDSIAVSVYPSAGDLTSLLRSTRERCRQHGVRLRVEHIGQFRRMQVPLANDSQLTEQVFNSCLIVHTWSCQTFYGGFFYLCSRPIYTDTYLLKRGLPPGHFRQIDGIALHEPHLLSRLRSYLQLAVPLAACKHCLGTVGKYDVHTQLTHEERKHPPAPVNASESIDATRLRRLLQWQAATGAILKRVSSQRISRLLAMAQTAVMGD